MRLKDLQAVKQVEETSRCVESVGNALKTPGRRRTQSKEDPMAYARYYYSLLSVDVNPFITEFEQYEPRMKEIMNELREAAAVENNCQAVVKRGGLLAARGVVGVIVSVVLAPLTVGGSLVGFGDAAANAVGGARNAIRSHIDKKKNKTRFKKLFTEFVEIVQSLQSTLEHLKEACEKPPTKSDGIIKLQNKIEELRGITARIRKVKTLHERADVCQKVVLKLVEIHSVAMILLCSR